MALKLKLMKQAHLSITNLDYYLVALLITIVQQKELLAIT